MPHAGLFDYGHGCRPAACASPTTLAPGARSPSDFREVNGRTASTKQETLPFCVQPFSSRFGSYLPAEHRSSCDFAAYTPSGTNAWWIEPVRHGEFRIDQPFLDLPNVIASPHNSAQGTGAHDISLRRAVENCRRALIGEAPLHVIGLDERLM